MAVETQHEDNDFIDVDALEVDLENKTKAPEEDELDIEIVDDTPEADRGRKPLQKDVLSEVDTEAEQYSSGVKKRMGELRHQAHDERRQKEAAIRERDEAIKLAKTTYERARALENQLQQGELSYAEEMAKKAELALANAKEKYRRAHEADDADGIAEAMAAMADAKQQESNAKRWTEDAKYRQHQNSARQKQEDTVESPQSSHQQQVIPADPRAVSWAEKNSSWFNTDVAMTSLAFGVHEHLIRSGIDPTRDADRYYATIDAEMRRRFPEYEWDDDDGQAGSNARATKQAAKRSAPVVAPVTRTSSGNKNRVVLTKSQVEMAKKCGLTLEQYAQEMLKLEKGN